MVMVCINKRRLLLHFAINYRLELEVLDELVVTLLEEVVVEAVDCWLLELGGPEEPDPVVISSSTSKGK